jgi:hypothetical protein
MFTARYALSPYIKQIRFVFKGLIRFGHFGEEKIFCPYPESNHYPSAVQSVEQAPQPLGECPKNVTKYVLQMNETAPINIHRRHFMTGP